jgi:hypothetical protein
VVQMAFPWCFLRRAHQVEDINCSSTRFLSLILHAVLLVLSHVSAASPNPVPRADSFAIVVRSWLNSKRCALG